MTREEELELLIEQQARDDRSSTIYPEYGFSYSIPLDAVNGEGSSVGNTVGVIYDFDGEEPPVYFSTLRDTVLSADFHGTRDGYSNHKCRCARCRRAQAKAQLEYTHRTGRAKPMEEELARRRKQQESKPHGTASKYGDGCRCDACRAAHAKARAAHRKRDHGSRSRHKYEVEGCRCDACRARNARRARIRRGQPAQIPLVTCECGKRFKPKRLGQKFCSRRCLQRVKARGRRARQREAASAAA